MRFACLVLSGFLALPAFADESVIDFIIALGDEAPAVRDRAQAELESRGASVVGELERAIGSADFRDAEIQARLREIVAKARRAEAWDKDPGSLATVAIAEESCLTCKQPNYAVEGEVTDEPFVGLVEGVKLFRVRCERCNPGGKGPESTAILFLKKSGGHALVRRGHVSRLVEVDAFLRPVKSAEVARESAAVLVALCRHAASVRVLEGARKTAQAFNRAEGGLRVSLNDVGDTVYLDFDADGRLVSATRADG